MFDRRGGVELKAEYLLERHPKLLLFYAVCIAAFATSTVFPLDDAYITLHNARSLLQGHDALYGVSPLTGATSSAHLAVLAALGAFLPLPLASILLCGIGALVYAVCLDALVRRAGVSGWRVGALVLAGLMIGTVPKQLFNGLETGWAMATVCGLLLLADSRWLPLLAGTAPFVRPELAALCAPLMLRQMHGKGLRAGVRTILLAGAAAIPLGLWVYASTGSPFPNTSGAKVAFFAEGDWPLGRRLAAIGAAFSQNGFLPLLLGLFPLWFVRAGRASLVYIAAVLLAAVWVLPGSLMWNQGRYLAPLVPCLLYGFTALVPQRYGMMLVAAVAVISVFTGVSGWFQRAEDRKAVSVDILALSQMLHSVPQGSVVLVHDAGMAAWINAPVRLVDVVGLKTPQSSVAHKALTRRSCKWGPALDRIARSAQAEYIVALRTGFWHCTVTNLEAEGWSVRPLGPTAGRYSLYGLHAPAGHGGP